MISLAWLRPGPQRYDLIQSDKDIQSHESVIKSNREWIWKTLLQFFVVLLLMIASFSVGWHAQGSTREETIELQKSNLLFRYNRTFGEPPSDTTNAAWESLFPQHGGFFVHPQLAPKRSALSVFHQLHCLDELRHGFYVLHNQVIAYANMTNEKRALPEHSLGHIRHCIDLLRQSLMCNADLTVELKDPELGGVTGFGTEHRCTDWQGLLDWIRPWEDKDAPPLIG